VSAWGPCEGFALRSPRGGRILARAGAGRARRHLNAAQRAILYAIAYPEPTPGKRTDLTCSETEQVAPPRATLSQARVIVHWAPDLVGHAGSDARKNISFVRAAIC